MTCARPTEQTQHDMRVTRRNKKFLPVRHGALCVFLTAPPPHRATVELSILSIVSLRYSKESAESDVQYTVRAARNPFCALCKCAIIQMSQLYVST